MAKRKRTLVSYWAGLRKAQFFGQLEGSEEWDPASTWESLEQDCFPHSGSTVRSSRGQTPPTRPKHRVHQHFTPYSSDSRGTNMGSNSPEIVCSLDMFGPSPGPYTNRHGRKGYEGKGDKRTEPISRQPKYRLPNRTGFGGTGRTDQL